jgi:hypothetical protein
MGRPRSFCGVEWSTEAAERYQLSHPEAQASDVNKCRLWSAYAAGGLFVEWLSGKCPDSAEAY